ncbi:PhzF family phenazine biosynthesis protein [Streptococcus vestibularis]|uniref:PhzF family phenazine biosynthesis protein n=1 Tax=Streptococcus vestibularis TaxID=1343 RepID=UPI002283A581|nr:PhzF family phenazine biosynthesis protein [Streptococcus vestibularis]MCY7043333.1 PhzF family phenazine biosynthesis protein [Streptococcus vestibularis]MDU3179691.1 PhzF family phenazine biosynthesis protein [Streptococcus vestibularis]
MPISQYTIPQFIVDAFTDTVFKGNPAAVCLLDEWLSDATLQNIAKENNLSETAFTVKDGDHYELRWFTPGGEIDLCGHATLATAFVLFQFIEVDVERLIFTTQSGELLVSKKDDYYELNFPSYAIHQVVVTSEMEEAIGVRPLEAWLGRDLVCILPHENDVINASPDFDKVKALDGLLLNITARGSNYDTVTRSFAPKLSVKEDPVCGSGHCHVIPLWANKLAQAEFRAYQASERSGLLLCRIEGDRIYLAGKASLYSRGEIYIMD